MPRLNKKGYLLRQLPGCGNFTEEFEVCYSSSGRGKISLHDIYVPKELIGKCVRIKVEVIKEKKQ